MKGSTNAMRGSADVVQSTSSISILDTTIQNSTDSQPGLMSAADHQQMTADHATLSTTVSQISTKQDKLTFDSEPTEGSSNPVTSGGVFNAINSVSGSVPLCKFVINSSTYIDLPDLEYSEGSNSLNYSFSLTLNDSSKFTNAPRLTYYQYYTGTPSSSDNYGGRLERQISSNSISDEQILSLVQSVFTIYGKPTFSTTIRVYGKDSISAYKIAEVTVTCVEGNLSLGSNPTRTTHDIEGISPGRYPFVISCYNMNIE